MTKVKKGILVFVILLLAAVVLRVCIARFLPNDDPYDGKVYAQMARNLLEQRVYSHETAAPYIPSIIRLPGYPLFLAGIYWLFGHGDNTAVRIVQALIDTLTCALVALLAFYWEPDPTRKRAAAIGALALAAICPFTTIYVTTILTETPTTFFMIAMCVTATLAFNEKSEKKVIAWWVVTGVLSGLAVLFRPDAGLFAAAIGITLVLSILFAPRDQKLRPDGKHERALRFSRASYLGALFSLAFCLVLVPWTIRNWRVFHVFQPLAPAYAQMPGEFVPRGYYLWLRTWLDDEREIAPLLWSLDESPIEVESIPDKAFDSAQEKQRVATLLEQYNHPHQDLPSDSPPGSMQFNENEESSPSPEASPSDDEDEDDEEEKPMEGGASQAEESDQPVAMTPEIDNAFAQLARERISRAPLRYYLLLPVKRAAKIWFNTHSQYYPFEGELFPEEGVRHTTAQQVWLPLFTALTWIYTFLAVVGCWYLWASGVFGSRRWLLLAVLMIGLRLAFFAFRENPEPRYVVEFFPILSVLGGIALVRVVESFKPSRK
jgi:hypothetical protein